MNTDKAYLLGLIIGGGKISRGFTNLTISLPYNKWGNSISNPTRAGKIARDILTSVKSIFRHEYNIEVYFDAEPEWRITCDGNLAPLIEDLKRFGINQAGELRKNATISGITPFLIDNNLKRQFVAGLADSVGSLAPSHRRFNDNFQIISFEFNGNNYKLVYQICRLFRELNCHADQILWNHPNQHSTDNPYYKNWRKGFKLRVLLDQYTAQGSFLFQAKQEAARDNIRLQRTSPHTAQRCEERAIDIKPKTVHTAENDTWLPDNVRGYHFIHHKHICAVMGCPFAPINKLSPYLQRIEYYINPYPIILRGQVTEIENIIKSEPTMANRRYKEEKVPVKAFLRTYQKDPNILVLGNTQDKAGYPINELLQAIAYVSAGVRRNLFGTRVRGNFLVEIQEAIRGGIIDKIRMYVPDKLTPIEVRCGDYAALVGPQNPNVYRKLIDREDELRVKIRKIREEDFDE